MKKSDLDMLIQANKNEFDEIKQLYLNIITNTKGMERYGCWVKDV